MAPHSSTLAWKIPWMEEPGGLPSMGSHRVGHDWIDLAAAAAAAEPSELIWSDSQDILIEETQSARGSISLRWKGNQNVINVSTHFCNTHTNHKSRKWWHSKHDEWKRLGMTFLNYVNVYILKNKINTGWLTFEIKTKEHEFQVNDLNTVFCLYTFSVMTEIRKCWIEVIFSVCVYLAVIWILKLFHFYLHIE